MNAYFDSSVVLRLVLGEPDPIDGWQSYDRKVVSALVEVEVLRTLDRIRLEKGVAEEEIVFRREAAYRLLEALECVDLSSGILSRATGMFPVSLRTLDALHLVTALAWQESERERLIMATHDASLARAARAFGLAVVGDQATSPANAARQGR